RDHLVEQISTLDPRPPRQVDDSTPKELERIRLKALSKRAADRHSTALDLAEDLRHWLEGDPGPAPRLGVTPAAAPVRAEPVPTGSGLAGPTPGPPASGSDPGPTKVVPKGLRSF